MFSYTEKAKTVVKSELEGLKSLYDYFPKDFDKTAEAIKNTKGRLIVSGIGKSGYIGQKISASFASTGTRAFYIHPAEASHGDLGIIGEDDIVLLLSNSGETKELIDIISYCKRFSIPIIGMTMQIDSLLARSSTYLLNIPNTTEASNVNAPTTSSTMMLALGDALVVAIHVSNNFTKEDFAIYHPGGKLGASLISVEKLMHKEDKLPFVKPDDKMNKALLEMTSKGFGCCAVVDNAKSIIGIITDGDLRRHMSDDLISASAQDVMTTKPITISPQIIAGEALAIMSHKNITSLLVAEDNKLVGILHINDLLRSGVK